MVALNNKSLVERLNEVAEVCKANWLILSWVNVGSDGVSISSDDFIRCFGFRELKVERNVTRYSHRVTCEHYGIKWRTLMGDDELQRCHRCPF